MVQSKGMPRSSSDAFIAAADILQLSPSWHFCPWLCDVTAHLAFLPSQPLYLVFFWQALNSWHSSKINSRPSLHFRLALSNRTFSDAGNDLLSTQNVVSATEELNLSSDLIWTNLNFSSCRWLTATTDSAAPHALPKITHTMASATIYGQSTHTSLLPARIFL